jgi:hypothetical protein
MCIYEVMEMGMDRVQTLGTFGVVWRDGDMAWYCSCSFTCRTPARVDRLTLFIRYLLYFALRVTTVLLGAERKN